MSTTTTKERVTKKFVNQNFKRVLCVPYCGLQSLLAFSSARWYVASGYGWDCDVFVYDPDTAIVTGYRAFGNIKTSSAVNHSFELRARDILMMRDTNEQAQHDLDALLDEYMSVYCGYCGASD